MSEEIKSPSVEEVRQAFVKTIFKAVPVSWDFTSEFLDVWFSKKTEEDSKFIANLSVYIPALLAEIDRLSRPRAWVERPTETGWWWMRRKNKTTFPIEVIDRRSDYIFFDGHRFNVSTFPGAEFQGPIAPDDVPAGEGGER